ncbi:hypothetical protein T4B_8784 [Trichinella pseudospiralis]|uniref:Uncharacterized protein n=1 Tax=Trichinella pseudospiralis TaxID=6337 RepID=A0A0V1IUB7_TRIPS|nr:hypothetical protein T4A_2515 [Trichinella pseudospiralis]KRZ26264.1 hypothetical protein T4B_8784 [Trichinella pseudospiralis]KRZ35437.1 hypothetical protein T4C_6173 [Trichinella pseudospiralis]
MEQQRQSGPLESAAYSNWSVQSLYNCPILFLHDNNDQCKAFSLSVLQDNNGIQARSAGYCTAKMRHK